MYACLLVFVCPMDGIRDYGDWMVYHRNRFCFFFPSLARVFTREEGFRHGLF